MRRLESAWLRGAPGAVAGLFLARVALEATHHPWLGVLVVAVGLLAALGGLALGRWLAQRRVHLWPVLPLLVTVLWPRRDPVVAAGVAILIVLLWLLSNEKPSLPRWTEALADFMTFVVALLVYVATAAPDVLPADAGEFQLVTALLGVAHPPGYPLYTLVGHLFIRLLAFLGETPAYRLNLMSGLLAAGTLVLVARATRLWARRLGASSLVVIVGGLAAALTLGTATTFWAQATIANVRTLAVFFAALALYALSRFATATDSREADRALILLGLALGLGGGHYPPLAFVSIFFVVYVLLTDPHLAAQPRRWWRPLLAGLASLLLPLTYLPIRGAMGAPLAPEGLDTLPGFLHHFLARGFAGDMFAFANAADLPHRLALLPTLFSFQFNFFLLAAALLGFLGLARRDWRLFLLLTGSLVLHAFVTITYRAPQTVEYLMLAYLPIAIAAGLLPALFSQSPTSALLLFCCSLVLWAGLLNGWAHAPSFVELAADHTARQAVEPLLETAPAGALILADWRWAMPLRYLREVEGLYLSDVEVQYVYPIAGKKYRDVWLQRVQDAVPSRPVLLTHFYEFDGYTTEPWETGFLIHPRPALEPSAPLTPVTTTFGENVRLLGYSLRQDQFHPGQVVEFVLAWQPTGPLDLQPSFTLRLVDEAGHDRAQVDRALTSDVIPGEVRFERLALPFYPNLPPGRYRVTLGAYTVTGAGFETLPASQDETILTLTELELTASPRPPFTLHRQAVPFAGGPTLAGVDYDRSVPDVLRVYLHWQGPVEGTWQVRVRTADGVEGTASLPPIPEEAYQTVTIDLSSPVDGSTWLALTDAQGAQAQAAGAWGWSVQEVRLPAAAIDAHFVPLGDEMAVIGVEAHSVAPGETMVVDVTLVALRPLTSDDSMSVRLMGSDGRWLDTHDSQPALSAIPTLKWIRGSRVVDRHLLQIPKDFTGEQVRATLLAYRNFQMIPLPSMDSRFGEIPLGNWTLP
ncbi:MAG: DUF2723 domain-containing protein [Anaerolineae bacterium]